MLFKQTLFVSAALACGCAYAQMIDLGKPEPWSNPSDLKITEDGILEVVGRKTLRSKQVFKIDPTKSYRITGEIRLTEGKKNTTYIGFMPMNKDRKRIVGYEFNVLRNTDTELIVDCNPADTVLMVKDASKWGKISSIDRLAFHTKKDYSDLPNANYSSVAIEEVKKDGDSWMIIMAGPVGKKANIGSGVRLHRGGGHVYTGGIRRLEPNQEWLKIDGTIKGHGKFGYSNHKAWPPGTVYAQLLIHTNWNTNTDGKEVLQLRNFKVEVVD